MAEKRKADAMTTPSTVVAAGAAPAAAVAPAGQPPAKKQAAAHAGPSYETSASLHGFELTRVLFSDPKAKRLCVLGTFAASVSTAAGGAAAAANGGGAAARQRAIVTFEKPAFVAAVAATTDAKDTSAGGEELRALLSGSTVLRHEMHNDVYYQFTATPTGTTGAAALLNDLKVDLICPCTDDDIRKKEPSPRRVLRESAQDYTAVTQPFIRASIPKGVQWVYNILEKKKEVDRLVLKDSSDAQNTGFMLSIDMKWDQKAQDALYLVAMPLRRDLYSLRDLNATHIPLLENMRDKSLKVISDRWGVPPHSILAFVHYYPAYYHLHVHFTHAAYDSEVTGSRLGRGHLLDDIIANLHVKSTYYADATLTVVLPALHPLHDKLVAHQKQHPGPPHESAVRRPSAAAAAAAAAGAAFADCTGDK